MSASLLGLSFDPVWALSCNAAAQVLVSSLLGTLMLIPMQPWGRKLAPKLNMRALLSTHLDWYMLAFMQWGAAFMMDRWPQLRSADVAALLMFGGWVNALPYLVRGFGLNAFVMGGGLLHRTAAAIAGVSVAAILAAWGVLLWGMWGLSSTLGH